MILLTTHTHSRLLSCLIPQHACFCFWRQKENEATGAALWNFRATDLSWSWPVFPVLLSLITARASSGREAEIYSREAQNHLTNAVSQGPPSPGLMSRWLWFMPFFLIHMWWYLSRKNPPLEMCGFGDSLSAGVKCVYTLTVVIVVGLAVAKCEEGYGAGYVCKSVERGNMWEETTKRGIMTERSSFSGFALVLLKDCSQPSIIFFSLINPSDSCVRGGTITVGLRGRKPLRCREEESRPEKVIQQKPVCSGPQGNLARLHENACISMWVHF